MNYKQIGLRISGLASCWLVLCAHGCPLPSFNTGRNGGSAPEVAQTCVSTEMSMAINSGDEQEVKKLLQGIFKPNERVCGVSYLSYAVEKMKPSIVKILLDAGATPNVADADGAYPLTKFPFYLGFEKGTAELTFTYLLNAGASPDVFNTQNTRTMLMEALARVVYWGRIPDKVRADEIREVIKLLLKAGANPHLKNNEGMSAIHFVTSSEELELIIDKGVDINDRDTNGRTVLMYLAQLRLKDVIAAALTLGADINAIDTDGKTPLHHVVEWGFLYEQEVSVIKPILKQLRDAGVDPYIKDKGGVTIIDIVSKYPELVEILTN